MWNDVVVGNGDSGNAATQIRAFNHPEAAISQNSVSYWVTLNELDICMTIFKDTVDGESLAGMLERRVDENFVKLFLEGIALHHIDKAKLRLKINDAIKRAYRKGRHERAAEIRKSLGL